MHRNSWDEALKMGIMTTLSHDEHARRKSSSMRGKKTNPEMAASNTQLVWMLLFGLVFTDTAWTSTKPA